MTTTNDFKMWVNRRIIEEDMSSARTAKIEKVLKQVDEILSGGSSCEISIDSDLNVDVKYL